jgi:NAD(P)-dependent dehydrogenase (short-subunit alcohol dehydrogenase family)
MPRPDGLSGPPIALVTGASGGIGLPTCRALVREGFHVVMACRNLDKAEPLRLALEQEARVAFPDAPPAVDLLGVDFASPASVRAFADLVLARYDRIDVLFANAGTFTYRRETTAEGFERTLAVNYLGMVLLVDRLIPLLRATAARTGSARLLVTSSIAAFSGRVRAKESFFRRSPGFFFSYAASKLAQALYTLQVAEELRGTGVVADCFHPGVVATGIFTGRTRFAKWLDAYMQRTALTPEQGAEVGIRLATEPEYAARTGGFYDKDGLRKLSRAMRDRPLRERFVAVTRALVAREEPAR